MSALPPQKSVKDKYYVGFFEDKTLVAVLDLITNYPAEKIAFIGFFMINMQFQDKGIGSNIIKEVCACLKVAGYEEVRLGVDQGNPQSYAFWTKNQFNVIDEKKYILMELKL